jgi:hypothetical protein
VKLSIEYYLAGYIDIPQMCFLRGGYHQIIVAQRIVYAINNEYFQDKKQNDKPNKEPEGAILHLPGSEKKLPGRCDITGLITEEHDTQNDQTDQ